MKYMTIFSIARYIRDPRPHTGPMYLVMGAAAAACAWRARREIQAKEEPAECPHTRPSFDSPAQN
jgi:hypothetical protein